MIMALNVLDGRKRNILSIKWGMADEEEKRREETGWAIVAIA